jgi:hypothetical protein
MQHPKRQLIHEIKTCTSLVFFIEKKTPKKSVQILLQIEVQIAKYPRYTANSSQIILRVTLLLLLLLLLLKHYYEFVI